MNAIVRLLRRHGRVGGRLPVTFSAMREDSSTPIGIYNSPVLSSGDSAAVLFSMNGVTPGRVQFTACSPAATGKNVCGTAELQVVP
jgi:hypothetical protein